VGNIEYFVNSQVAIANFVHAFLKYINRIYMHLKWQE